MINTTGHIGIRNLRQQAPETHMSKFEINKTIEARKLNRRTGIPLTEPSVTIPYGGIIEDLTEDGNVIKFSYLGEPYQAPRELVSSVAVPAQSFKPGPPANGTPDKESRPAPIAEPALQWEPVKSSHHPDVIRARVPGGWLVSVPGAGLAFYPDPEHRWKGGVSQREPTAP